MTLIKRITSSGSSPSSSSSSSMPPFLSSLKPFETVQQLQHPSRCNLRLSMSSSVTCRGYRRRRHLIIAIRTFAFSFSGLLLTIWISTGTTTPVILGTNQSSTPSISSEYPKIAYSKGHELQVQHPHKDPDLHLVISYCRMSIDWIFEKFLSDYDPQLYIETGSANDGEKDPNQQGLRRHPLDRIATIWVYSKCYTNDKGGNDTDQLELIRERLVNFFTHRTETQNRMRVPEIKISTLDNVGRCDHTYAYWILNHALLVPSNSTSSAIKFEEDDEVLFIKDNDNKDHIGYIQLNTIYEMEELMRATTNGDRNGNQREPYSAFRLRRQTSVAKQGQHGRGFACSTRISSLGWNHRAPDVIDAEKLGNFYLRDYVRDFHKTHSHSDGYRAASSDSSVVESPLSETRVSTTVPPSEVYRTTHSTTADVALFESPHRPLRKFVEEMKMTIDGITERTTKLKQNTNTSRSRRAAVLDDVSFVPICYCGSFLTTIRRIRNAPIADWALLLRALSRGDNIEEGHYMERLWAALLSKPLSTEEQHSLRRQVVSWDENGTPFIDPTGWIENTQLF